MTICSERGAATPLTDPNPVRFTTSPLAFLARFVMAGLVRLAKFAVPLKPVNCVWLRALNASMRNSNFRLFGPAKIFESERSR